MEQIRENQRVRVKREIRRIDPFDLEAGFQLYASAGDEGVVEEIFFNYPPIGGPKSKKMRRYFAKVRIGAALKTFRLVSLERLK